jgi:hypothetical protein
MLDLPSLPVFGLLGLGAAELGIIVGIIAVLAAIPIVIAGLYFRHQQQKLWHETARVALEKGQPLPPQAAEDDQRRSGPDVANDFRAGLVLIGLGAGLYFFLGRGIAAIVGFIGIALLIYATFAALFHRKNPPQNPVPRT